MFCSQCGQKAKKEDRFCAKCGNELHPGQTKYTADTKDKDFQKNAFASNITVLEETAGAAGDTNSKKTRKDKEYFKNLLIAIPPAMFIFVALEQIGLKGALVPIVTYFGGAYLVGKYRQNHQHYSKKKLLLIYLCVIVVAFLLGVFVFSLNEARSNI